MRGTQIGHYPWRHRLLATIALFSWAFAAIAAEPSSSGTAACIVSDIQNIREKYSERIEARKSPTERGNYVEQPVSDLQALYEKARLSKKIFDRALKGLAKDLGVEAVTADLKTFDRTREKVSGKLLGEVSALTDVLRGTIICDKYSQIEAIKRKISDRFEDVKFIDRFENPKPNGYRDLQAIVLVPSKRRGEKPIWAEIQIHLRPLYMAKKSGDALYQRWRKIEEYGAHHPLSDEQSAELNSLKEQEKQLYNQALIEASQ